MKLTKLLKTFLITIILICLVTTSIPMTFAAAPKIASIQVNDLEIIEGTDGWYTDDYDYNTDEYVEWYMYFYDFIVDYTVTLTDGTVIESNYGWVEYNDENYYLNFTDDQSYENQWELGTHEVTAELLGCKTTFNITIIESPIESIEVQDVEIIEGSNTTYVEEYDYDTDEYNEWYKYDYQYLVDYTVTLKDGTVIESDCGWLEYNDENYYLSFTDDQSYENQWGVGTYEVTAELFGCEATFNVTITESPVKSIEIENVDVYQDIDGDIYCQYNPETDEYDLEYFDYCYNDLIDCTITLKDGTVINDIYYDDEFSEESYLVSFFDDQSYENQWGLGAHTVEARLLGCITTFEVNVLESPVASVEFENVEEIENSGGYYEEYCDPDTEEVLDIWYYYNYTVPKCTITLNDGTIITNSEEDSNIVFFNGTEHYIHIIDDQSYENQWELGTHIAEGKIFGKTASFNVNIVKSPVSKVEIKDVERIVDTGFTAFTEDGKEWQQYWYSFFGFDITVTLNDGTILTNDEEYPYINYNGNFYSVENINDDQSYENQWGLGAHKVNASVMGFETSFNVNIIESPVSSIEFENENIVLTEDDSVYYYYIDPETGEEISWYEYNYFVPDAKVTLKDGTVLETHPQSGSIFYKGQLYFQEAFDDQSYDNQWGVGTHTAYVSIMGATAPVNITIVPSSTTESIFGDANGDGEVNITDATEIQKHCAGLLEFSSEIIELCDINLDGEINVLDATELQKYLADLIQSDLIGKPYYT